MKKIFFNILFLLIWMLTEKFFFLVPLKYDPRDIIFIIGTIFIIFSLNKFIIFTRRNKLMIFYLSGLFVINFVSTSLNYHYSLLNQFKGGRFLLSYIVMFYLSWIFIDKNTQGGKKELNIPYVLALFLILINFYVFLSGNLNIFTYQLKVSERFNEIRFLVGGTSIIYLYLFYISKSKPSVINLSIVFLLFGTALIVGKTRGVIIPMALTFIVLLLFGEKKLKIRIYIILISLSIFFLLILVFGIKEIQSPFKNIADSTINAISDNGLNNYTIRLMSLSYYWEIFIKNIYNLIFGVGYEAVESVSSLSKKFYLSDIGFFKTIYYQGAVGVMFLVYILRNLYIKSKKTNSIRILFLSFLIFQIVSLPTLNFFYHPTSALYFFMLYSSIEINQNMNKISTPILQNQ